MMAHSQASGGNSLPDPLRQGRSPHPTVSAKLRIAHILAPGRFGGLERVVEMLSREQAEAGHEVHAILTVGPTAADHPLAAELAQLGVRVTVVTLPPRSYLTEQRELRRLLEGISPDVIHTHGYRPDVLVRRVARRLGIAMVSTAHGFTGGSWKNRFFEWLQIQSWRRIDGVVAVSRTLAARLESVGVPPARLHVVPNAWRAGEALLPRAEARAALQLPPDVIVIGWVGRLSWEKAADVMIHALPHLSRAGVVLAIVGTGRERAALESLASELNVSHRIYWIGELRGAARYFSAFDCFALSSRTEGTPIALFEAIAAGVPVVATAVGGVPDVIGAEEGRLVAPQDPEALARAIEEVFEHRTEADTRVAAASRRLADFDGEKWQARYSVVYRHAMAQVPGSI